MVSLDSDSKTCKNCNDTKPLVEFYKNGKDTYCIPCRLLINKRNNEKRKAKSVDQQEEISTAIGRALLKEHGIPCVTGYSVGMKWVDLVAWGCVPVEVKIATASKSQAGKFTWSFTERQRTLIHKGAFLFVGIDENGLRPFIVPCTESWITKDNGKLWHGAVSVVVGTTHFNSSTWHHLKHFENAFDVIERLRLEQSAALASGTTESVKLAIAELAKVEPDLSIEALPLFRMAA